MWVKLGSSFASAFFGLAYAFLTQRNMRIHLLATVLVGLVGWLAVLPAGHWAALVLAIGFVWAAELFNTALESLVDLIEPGYHRLAKVAKNVAAGAVLSSALTAITVGLAILGPRLGLAWQRLGQMALERRPAFFALILVAGILVWLVLRDPAHRPNGG
ncbi:MAG: diacylglycerol kinase family protein [Bacillota bacterium]